VEQSELASASSWLHWLSLIKYVGGAIVVVGVVAELLGDWFSQPLQKRLDDARKLEIALLRTEGQRLSKEAETAKASIADANARAVEAELALEKFKAQRALNAAQEAFKDQRALNAAQEAGLKSAVAKFSGVPFDITVNTETEPQNFASQIGKLLESAGWVWKERNNSPGPKFSVGGHSAGMTTKFSGFGIEIDVSRVREWQPALLALGNFLRTEGFSVVINVANDDSASPDAIHLYFGTKK
jgi:hypothetical protein